MGLWPCCLVTFIVLLFLRDHKTVRFHHLFDQWNECKRRKSCMHARPTHVQEPLQHNTNEATNYHRTCKDRVWAFCRGRHRGHKTETKHSQVAHGDGQIAWIDGGRVYRRCSNNHFCGFWRCFVVLKWPLLLDVCRF